MSNHSDHSHDCWHVVDVGPFVVVGCDDTGVMDCIVDNEIQIKFINSKNNFHDFKMYIKDIVSHINKKFCFRFLISSQFLVYVS